MLSLSSGFTLSFAPAGLPAAGHAARASTASMDAATFKKFVDAPVADFTLEKPWTSGEIQDEAGLKALADKLNPVVGYFDPLGIVPGMSKETIGWWRHAEIKHGRVAMAAFVGYLVQANGVHFPWNLQVPTGAPDPTNAIPAISFADISAAGGPADQWDALPSAAKIQIILTIGFLELVSESSVFLEMDGEKHYVRGGKPGYFPKITDKMPHPVPLNFWDPFGLTKKLSAEKKEEKLLAEINNGRLAMIGIFGLISASKGLIVPGLDSLGVAPYGGEIMAPFSGNPDLPWVAEMNLARAEQIVREAGFLGEHYLNNGA